MALKTDLSDMSISSTRASIGTLRVVLKAWNEADSTMTDEPVIDEPITQTNVKYYVEGETPEALAERAKDKIKSKAKAKTDYYQTENQKISNATSAFQSMVSEVDNELNEVKI
jgi:hypothetical protein